MTRFFRDPEVFERLEKEEIPRLFGRKGPPDAIRMWSVGCATGEEAYSLAILLQEEAGRHEAVPHIQVFASDLHRLSLDLRRNLTRRLQPFYSGDIETDVSAERLKRFFQRENSGYRIRKEIRDMVVFAPHNLLADPPFSRLDLISCRNLLIYLEREVQRDVVELFHYALNPEGTLLLGSAEAMEASDLFRTEEKKLCLYRKRNVPAREPRLPVFPLSRGPFVNETGARSNLTGEPIPYGKLHQQMVERYAPPSILIGPDNRLVHLSERAGRYLIHPGGEPTTTVLKLVREELRIELQASLQTARENREALDSKPIPVRFNGDSRPVVLHVRPALEPDRDGFALIIFEERPPQLAIEETKAEAPDSAMAQVQELETELSMTRQRLQAIIEEYETSQEEMKASSEEMQSTNEELRSTMEELETSKEELQSINEELQTVNQQNRLKVEELAQLSSDLQNLLVATDIATLFLDRELRILRFTPKLGELFNILATDRGRPISDLTHRLGYGDLLRDAAAVLGRLVPVEREVQDDQGRWYLARVLPYRSTEDRIEGEVITFVDIDTRKRAEDALRASQQRYHLAVEAAPNGMVVVNGSGEIVLVNSCTEKLFGYKRDELIGQPVEILVPARFKERHKEDREQFQGQPEARAMGAGRELFGLKKDGVEFPIEIGLNPIKIDTETLVLSSIVDITERRQMEQQRLELLAKDRALASERALRETEWELARVLRALSAGELVTSIAHEVNQPLAAVITHAEAGLRWLDYKAPKIDEVKETLRKIVDDGNRAAAVVQRIRGYLQKGQQEDKSLDANEVVQESLAIAEGELLRRKIVPRTELAGGLPPIRGDRVQLQQVLLNLILNGAEAMTSEDGKKELVVKSEISDGGVLVAVRDSGPGISLEEIPRIFEPFYTKKPGGIGMGLSISRTIVEAHSGRIWAERNDGLGLTVQFWLPADGSE